MMDYSVYYRHELSLKEEWPSYDLFISVFNSSDRVQDVFVKVRSEKKFWLIVPEYEFKADERPENNCVIISGKSESEQIRCLADSINLSSFSKSKVCIDLTGFMRPQILFLLFYFKNMGFDSVDFLYSEPDHYLEKEKTQFSKGSVYITRQINGYSGNSNFGGNKDLLIISSGYDTNLIAKTAQFKENAEIVQILGFPSLRADMYQENVLRTVAAAESFTSNTLSDPIFAPASDPFETASIILNYIKKNKCLDNYHHIYISPLSTKAQTLGIGLVYLDHFANKPVSIIYPFTSTYSKETSVGLSRVWSYTVEFS